MGLSNFVKNKVIDQIWRDQDWSPPADLYVALFTVAPTDAGGGTEVSGGAYARVLHGPSLTTWKATQGGTTGASSGTNGTTSNAGTITFPAPVGAAWNVIVAFGVFDAIASGNMVGWGVLTTPKTVNDGDPAPVFQDGALVATITSAS